MIGNFQQGLNVGQQSLNFPNKFENHYTKFSPNLLDEYANIHDMDKSSSTSKFTLNDSVISQSRTSRQTKTTLGDRIRGKRSLSPGQNIVNTTNDKNPVLFSISQSEYDKNFGQRDPFVLETTIKGNNVIESPRFATFGGMDDQTIGNNSSSNIVGLNNLVDDDKGFKNQGYGGSEQNPFRDQEQINKLNPFKLIINPLENEKTTQKEIINTGNMEFRAFSGMPQHHLNVGNGMNYYDNLGKYSPDKIPQKDSQLHIIPSSRADDLIKNGAYGLGSAGINNNINLSLSKAKPSEELVMPIHSISDYLNSNLNLNTKPVIPSYGQGIIGDSAGMDIRINPHQIEIDQRKTRIGSPLKHKILSRSNSNKSKQSADNNRDSRLSKSLPPQSFSISPRNDTSPRNLFPREKFKKSRSSINSQNQRASVPLNLSQEIELNNGNLSNSMYLGYPQGSKNTYPYENIKLSASTEPNMNGDRLKKGNKGIPSKFLAMKKSRSRAGSVNSRNDSFDNLSAASSSLQPSNDMIKVFDEPKPMWKETNSILSDSYQNLNDQDKSAITTTSNALYANTPYGYTVMNSDIYTGKDTITGANGVPALFENKDIKSSIMLPLMNVQESNPKEQQGQDQLSKHTQAPYDMGSLAKTYNTNDKIDNLFEKIKTLGSPYSTKEGNVFIDSKYRSKLDEPIDQANASKRPGGSSKEIQWMPSISEPGYLVKTTENDTTKVPNDQIIDYTNSWEAIIAKFTIPDINKPPLGDLNHIPMAIDYNQLPKNSDSLGNALPIADSLISGEKVNPIVASSLNKGEMISTNEHEKSYQAPLYGGDKPQGLSYDLYTPYGTFFITSKADNQNQELTKGDIAPDEGNKNGKEILHATQHSSKEKLNPESLGHASNQPIAHETKDKYGSATSKKGNLGINSNVNSTKSNQSVSSNTRSKSAIPVENPKTANVYDTSQNGTNNPQREANGGNGNSLMYGNQANPDIGVISIQSSSHKSAEKTLEVKKNLPKFDTSTSNVSSRVDDFENLTQYGIQYMNNLYDYSQRNEILKPPMSNISEKSNSSQSDKQKQMEGGQQPKVKAQNSTKGSISIPQHSNANSIKNPGLDSRPPLNIQNIYTHNSKDKAHAINRPSNVESQGMNSLKKNSESSGYSPNLLKGSANFLEGKVQQEQDKNSYIWVEFSGSSGCNKEYDRDQRKPASNGSEKSSSKSLRTNQHQIQMENLPQDIRYPKGINKEYNENTNENLMNLIGSSSHYKSPISQLNSNANMDFQTPEKTIDQFAREKYMNDILASNSGNDNKISPFQQKLGNEDRQLLSMGYNDTKEQVEIQDPHKLKSSKVDKTPPLNFIFQNYMEKHNHSELKNRDTSANKLKNGDNKSKSKTPDKKLPLNKISTAAVDGFTNGGGKTHKNNEFLAEKQIDNSNADKLNKLKGLEKVEKQDQSSKKAQRPVNYTEIQYVNDDSDEEKDNYKVLIRGSGELKDNIRPKDKVFIGSESSVILKKDKKRVATEVERLSNLQKSTLGSMSSSSSNTKTRKTFWDKPCVFTCAYVCVELSQAQ